MYVCFFTLSVKKKYCREGIHEEKKNWKQRQIREKGSRDVLIRHCENVETNNGLSSVLTVYRSCRRTVFSRGNVEHEIESEGGQEERERG